MKIRIKFCGMTNAADAVEAANLGIDAIGLIFHPGSVRKVSASVAAEISKCLPPFVTKVGVFVNEDAEVIRSILKLVPLDVLQFHGNEKADFCRSFNQPYLKTIHIGNSKITEDYDAHYPDASGFLLDTKVENLPGGSGVVFNWEHIPHYLKKPLILAGGLNPENVQQAIKTVKPYAVDVTSGIEKTKGIKDSLKMKQFVNAVMDSCKRS